METFTLDNFQFYTFLMDVEEEINKKDLKNFLISSLKLQNIKINKKTNIYHSYISELKKYQITVYENSLPFLYLFSYLTNKIFDVLFYSSFIIVYKNKKLYYFTHIKYDLNNDELKELISNKLAVKINEINYIKKVDYEKIKLDDKSSLTFFNFYNLLILFLSIFFSSIFLIYSLFQSKEKKIYKVKVPLVKEYEYKTIFILDLIKLIHKYKLDLEKITYEKDKFTCLVSSKKIENINKFLDEKKFIIKIISLSFNKNKSYHELLYEIKRN